mmetsp:Transcript_29202/g.73464  ORF Transcript_29202/g.73464 Transcript_29202/m.73464 type:complete len:220 (+) Transcript_29202:47-706(+)
MYVEAIGADHRTSEVEGFAPIHRRLGQVLVGELPVDELPPGIDVRRTSILVIDVVGMLPHVNGEDRSLTRGQRVASIMGAYHLELTVGVLDEPCPARAKVSGSSSGELLLEGIKAAKVTNDGFSDRTSGFSSALRGQRVPVEGVVPGLSSAVEHTSSTGSDELLQGLASGVVLGSSVQLGHVALMMFTIVKINGLLRDVRSQSRALVRKGRKLETVRHS